ncbi:MAG: methyltransferase domain-containing protein [Chloroflexota bacterium]
MTDNATDQIRKDWDSQADSWYRQREAMLAASRPIHEWLVEHVEPKDGQQVLEIAAGPGDTGFMVAKQLGSGRLLSTDISSVMVDAARKRGAELGIENADYRVLDAQAMDLSAESFDGVICRWGFMLMPDPAASFRECRRVLKPGGRLAFAVFTGPQENPFAALPARVLIEAGHLSAPDPSVWRPGILALGDRARLQSLLDGSGFASTQVEAVDMAWTFRDADDYWTFLVDLTALGPLIRSLSNDARTAVRKTIDERLVSFSSADGIVLPSRCWCGLAVR